MTNRLPAMLDVDGGGGGDVAGAADGRAGSVRTNSIRPFSTQMLALVKGVVARGMADLTPRDGELGAERDEPRSGGLKDEDVVVIPGGGEVLSLPDGMDRLPPAG